MIKIEHVSKGTYASNVLNVTSSGDDFGRCLSPFLLGPVNLYHSFVSKTMENAWQYCKVYGEFVDDNNIVTQDYFKWAKNGWLSTKANRYPMGKGKKPLYSLWKGYHLNYIDARRHIYIPLYRDIVLLSPYWQRLKDFYARHNRDIILLDYDIYKGKYRGNYNSMISDEDSKLGHAYVLAMMLEWSFVYSINTL